MAGRQSTPVLRRLLDTVLLLLAAAQLCKAGAAAEGSITASSPAAAPYTGQRSFPAPSLHFVPLPGLTSWWQCGSVLTSLWAAGNRSDLTARLPDPAEPLEYGAGESLQERLHWSPLSGLSQSPALGCMLNKHSKAQ